MHSADYVVCVCRRAAYIAWMRHSLSLNEIAMVSILSYMCMGVGIGVARGARAPAVFELAYSSE